MDVGEKLLEKYKEVVNNLQHQLILLDVVANSTNELLNKSNVRIQELEEQIIVLQKTVAAFPKKPK